MNLSNTKKLLSKPCKTTPRNGNTVTSNVLRMVLGLLISNCAGMQTTPPLEFTCNTRQSVTLSFAHGAENLKYDPRFTCANFQRAVDRFEYVATRYAGFSLRHVRERIAYYDVVIRKETSWLARVAGYDQPVGVMGLAYCDEHRIEVGSRALDEASTLPHELFHAVDSCTTATHVEWDTNGYNKALEAFASPLEFTPLE